jgi:hypothetical protein
MKGNRRTKYIEGRDGNGKEYGKLERMKNIKGNWKRRAIRKHKGREYEETGRPTMHLCCPFREAPME